MPLKHIYRAAWKLVVKRSPGRTRCQQQDILLILLLTYLQTSNDHKESKRPRPLEPSEIARSHAGSLLLTTGISAQSRGSHSKLAINDPRWILAPLQHRKMQTRCARNPRLRALNQQVSHVLAICEGIYP